MDEFTQEPVTTEPNTAEPAPVDGAPNQPATTEPNTQEPEKTFTQAELDKIIGERLGRERQKASPYQQFVEAEANKYGMTAEQYLQAIEQQRQAEQLQSEAQRVGTSPQVLQELNTLKQELNSFRYEKNLLEAQKTMADKPFFNEWKGDIEQTARQYGTDLQTAYDLLASDNLPKIVQDYEAKLKSAKDDAVKEYLKAKSQPTGKVEGIGATPVVEAKSPKTFEEAKRNSIAMLKAVLQKE